jgi:cytochrome P450
LPTRASIDILTGGLTGHQVRSGLNQQSKELPLSSIFDPTLKTFAENREAVYRELRDNYPIYHDLERDTWVLSRFEDVRHAAADDESFSSDAPATAILLPMLNFLDAPRHSQLRRLVSRAFTPSRLADMEGMVQRTVDALLDRFIKRGGGDLIADYSGPLAANVIGSLIGIPEAEIDDFRELTDRLLLGDSTKLAEIAAGIYGMFKTLLSARRAEPEDDLMSALVQVQSEGGISDEEVLGFCFLLVSGGNDTTSNLIANGWLLFLDHPDQRKIVEDDRSQLPDAIEEMLRLRPPAESHIRTTTLPVELHGSTIPKGSKVQLLWGAANLDEREFTDPGQFDVTRSARHLTFGWGPHFCMGASLGRLEARIAFEGLLDRATGLVLSGRPTRIPSPWAYAYKALNLSLPEE